MILHYDPINDTTMNAHPLRAIFLIVKRVRTAQVFKLSWINPIVARALHAQ